MSLTSTQEDLENGEDVAECPSCSLIVKVIYDPVSDSGAHPIRDVYSSGMKWKGL